MDKWMDMLGLYDFLGVICPGIFVAGSIILIILTNSNILVDCMSYSDIFKSITKNESLMKTFSYYIYAYIIVVIYVLGSLVHELGHIGEWIHNHGLNTILNISHPKVWIKGIFIDGCTRAEERYLTEDLSNSNELEREYWVKLLIKSDFTRRKIKDFNVNELYVFIFEEKPKCEYGQEVNEYNIKQKQEDDVLQKKIKNISAEFYQHCKRVVAINGLDHSSKKKESIYGFSRNISFIFLDLAIILIVLSINNRLSYTDFNTNLLKEILCCLFAFTVFRIKSIRYKNMEIVDVLRAYRYIADNKKKFYANKK